MAAGGLFANDIQIGVVQAFLQLKDDGFFNTLDQASSAVENFEKNTNSGMSALEKTSRLTGDIGSSLYRNVTVPAIQAGKSIIGAYESTESAFTGVKKTLDEDELIKQFGSLEKAYDSLDKAIWQMTQETGSSYEAIAGVMEMAGQLNVPIGKAGKSLIDFTKNIIMLNDTTDLLGADAAKVLAQFVNITGTADDEFGNLGATIVDLGNNTATTEADIVAMAAKIAGAGTSLGLTEQEILAISATLNSVGIKAEMGGSAFSKAIKKMGDSAVTYDKIIALQDATGMSLDELNLMAQNNSSAFKDLADSIGMGATDMNKLIKSGLQLQGFAEISNMTMQEFSETMKNEPIKAVEAFILGLGDTENAGKTTVEMLQDMGFTEVRLSDTLTRLALAQDDFTENLKKANDAWDEGSALEIEANRRYGDLAVQISQLMELWKELQVDLAQFLVPTLKDVMEVLRGIIGFIKELPDPVKHVLMIIAEVATVAGPLLLVVSKITGALSNLKTLFGGMTKLGILDNCHKLGDCMENTAKNIGEVGKSFETVSSGVGSVIKHLAGVAAVVGGVALAILNFVDMWRNGVNIVNSLLTVLGTTLVGLGLFLTGLTGPIGIVVGAIVGGVLVAVAAIHEHWDEIVAWFKNLWEGVKEWWDGFWEGIKEGVSNFVENFKESLNNVKESWDTIWNAIGEAWNNLWDGIFNFFYGIVTKIREEVNKWFNETFGEEGLLTGIPAIIQEGLNVIFTFIATTIDAVTSIFKDLFNILVDLFTGNFDKLLEDLKKLWTDVKSWFTDMGEAVTNFFVTIFNTAKENFDKITDSVKEFFTNIGHELSERFSNLINGVKEFFSNLGDTLTDLIGRLKDKLHELFESLMEVVNNLIDAVKNAVSAFIEVVTNLIDSAKELISSVIETVKNIVGTVIDTIKELIDKVKESLGDLWNNVTTIFKETFEKVRDFVKEKIDDLIEWFKELPDKFKETGKKIIDALWEGMKSVWGNITSWFEEKFGWISDLVERIKGAVGGITDKVSGLLPGHANGLDYVPYDNYVARLHEGERVLTKSENEAYSNGKNGSGGDTFNFYNTQPDPYEYARQMKRVKKELALS